MGRVKNIAIKIAQHGSKFSSDFDANKKALAEVKEIKSTRVRNILAGYITREMKKAEKPASVRSRQYKNQPHPRKNL